MAEPEILPPASPSTPPANTAFRGPNGLRAGWRVLIFLAIVIGLGIVLALGVFLVNRGRSQFAQGQLTPSGTAMAEGAIFLVAAGAALIMALIEHRPFGRYGLPARFAFRKDFWIGTMFGFLSISGTLGVIFLLHGFRLTGFAIHGQTILTSALAWAAAFVLVGLAEEFLFRGYLQFTLTTGIGFWPSAICLSLLFGAAHSGNPGETKFGLFSVVLFGLLFCLFLRRTGNLWWAVGFHAGWDWGQTFFYGVADSGLPADHSLFNSAFNGPRWITGGSVGPEASIFTVLVLAVVAILFHRAYRENRYVAP